MSDFSHSCIRWLAVLLNDPADFLRAGHGIGSRFVESIFVGSNGSKELMPVDLGLPDTVEGKVLVSEVTLDDERDCSGLSSHVSQPSFDMPESLFAAACFFNEGCRACFDTVAFFT